MKKVTTFLAVQANTHDGQWINWDDPQTEKKGIAAMVKFKKESPLRKFRLVRIETTETVIRESK